MTLSAIAPHAGGEAYEIRHRQRAARRIQFEYRVLLTHRKALDLEHARELADDRMPHAADGRLYRVKPLTEPFRPWRSGAPISGVEVYDTIGVGGALYMRLVYGARRLFAVLFVVSLVPLLYNMMGSKATVEATRNYVIHSLGNADELSLLAHGLPDLLSVLLTCAFLVYGARRLRAVSEELHPLEVNQASELSAKDYTCMVEGLPRDPALSFNSLVSQLRGLFSEYGEVISVSVATFHALPCPSMPFHGRPCPSLAFLAGHLRLRGAGQPRPSRAREAAARGPDAADVLPRREPAWRPRRQGRRGA